MTEQLDTDSALQALFARPGTAGKTHVEKHLAACNEEVDPSHGRLWRRLLLRLSAHTPLPIQGLADGVMLFSPDGRYRMQVFAIEDHKDGMIRVFLPDVLDKAIERGVLLPANEEGEFGIPGAEGISLRVDRIDAANTKLPPPHLKNMLGWNRKCLQVTLVASQCEGPRVDATEAICELAVRPG